MDYKMLADYARVWIYQANRELNDAEVGEIRKHGEKFINQWAAHGADLKAAFHVFYNRFVVLFADESQVKASGCSIDSSVRFIKELAALYDIDLFDRLNIAFKQDDKIDTLRMHDFQEALEQGKLGIETIVFNNLVETKGDFETKWEVPINESWHKQLVK